MCQFEAVLTHSAAIRDDVEEVVETSFAAFARENDSDGLGLGKLAESGKER